MIPVSSSVVLAFTATLLLGGCGLLASSQSPPGAEARAWGKGARTAEQADEAGNDVVLYALGLIETGYRFGGKNPEAGLDCSGMVSHVFERAAGVKLSGSAADMARRGRPIAPTDLRPGDLVFFNTRDKSYSHVGIYIGGGRFVHAPSASGRVRADRLDTGWFASRFEEARAYFD